MLSEKHFEATIRNISSSIGETEEQVSEKLNSEEKRLNVISHHILMRLKWIKDFLKNNRLDDYSYDDYGRAVQSKFDEFSKEIGVLTTELDVILKFVLQSGSHRVILDKLKRQIKEWSFQSMKFNAEIVWVRRYLNHVHDSRDNKSVGSLITDLSKFFPDNSRVLNKLQERGFTQTNHFRNTDELYSAYYGVYENLIKELNKLIASMIKEIVHYIQHDILGGLEHKQEEIDDLLEELGTAV